MKKKELTAADVWAMLAETDKIVKETSKTVEKTSKKVEETTKVAEEAIKAVKDVSKQVGDVSRQMGGINDNIGFHAEQYFQDLLAKKLIFGGRKYDRMIPNLECFGKNGVSLIEFDIVLVNGRSVAIIETKSRIHPGFVKKLVEERLPKFREFFPGFSKCKAYLGIAGFSFSKKVLEEAEKYGLGIMKQVGEGVEVKADNLRAY